MARQLVHEGFTDDGAKKAAKIYRENASFIQLDDRKADSKDEVSDVSNAKSGEFSTKNNNPIETEVSTQVVNPPSDALATYSIPLGRNDATLTFVGEELTTEDFDALIDYVELFKAQFKRRQEKSTERLMSEFAKDGEEDEQES